MAAAFPGHTSDGPFDAKTKQNKKKLKILPSRVLYVLPRFPVQCFDGIDLYERGSAVLEKHAYGQDWDWRCGSWFCGLRDWDGFWYCEPKELRWVLILWIKGLRWVLMLWTKGLWCPGALFLSRVLLRQAYLYSEPMTEWKPERTSLRIAFVFRTFQEKFPQALTYQVALGFCLKCSKSHVINWEVDGRCPWSHRSLCFCSSCLGRLRFILLFSHQLSAHSSLFMWLELMGTDSATFGLQLELSYFIFEENPTRA